MRHHTTQPVQPVRPIGAIDPVEVHRRDAPARAMLKRAQQFYRRRLRALAKTKPKEDRTKPE